MEIALRPHVIFAFAAALALLPAPALAASADGTWQCNAFGTTMAILGFKGDGYTLANPHGRSGRGTIAYAGERSFTIAAGPLLTELGLEQGIAAVDNGEALLILENKRGERLFCYGQ